MPYKDPERKRQWEREHRKQRNATRRLQRLPTRSGPTNASNAVPDPVTILVARLQKRAPDAATATHACATKPTSDIVAALRTRRKLAPDPIADQKPKSA
jgi:hypothetical protein